MISLKDGVHQRECAGGEAVMLGGSRAKHVVEFELVVPELQVLSVRLFACQAVAVLGVERPHPHNDSHFLQLVSTHSDPLGLQSFQKIR